MKFNINSQVRVKLTDHGRKIHKEEHEAFWRSVGRDVEYMAPEEDKTGWSEWQMWNLMQIFGPHINLAGPLCFETEIDITGA